MTTTIKRIAVAVALCACSLAALADRTYKLDIPPQPLNSALRRFAEQSGLQVVYYTRIADGRTTARVTGSLSASEALRKLLAGTDLVFQSVNADTIAIRAARSDEKNTSSAADPVEQMRLASAADAAKQARETAAEASESGQVVVEGARERAAPFTTGNLDLTRTEDDVLPFSVFTAREIQLSGAADLAEFLRARLPQNISDDNATQLDSSGMNVAAVATARNTQVDMRGWGGAETVFLLNGRRMGAEFQSGAADGGLSSPNLRGIPLGSVERIEVLTSAGSAIYGPNATGGVINIITRQDYSGGQLSLGYQTPSDVLRPQRSLGLTYGMPLKWGFGLRVDAGYSDSEPLRLADRAEVTVERFRRLAMERDPHRLITRVTNAADPGSTRYTQSLVNGATPNIRATTNTVNLFAGLPGVPGSNYTTVPDGYTGGGGRSAFQPGTYNIDLPDVVSGTLPQAKRATLGMPGRSTSFTLGLDKQFNDRWRWSTEYRYRENRSSGDPSTDLRFSSSAIVYNASGITTASGSLAVIPRTALTNPFGVDVQVLLNDPALDRPELGSVSRDLTWDLTSTLQGAIGEWRGYFDVSHTRSRQAAVRNRFGEPFGGWAAAIASGAFNPFVDSRVRPHASAQFYENYTLVRHLNSSASQTTRSTVKASGPVLTLPAGAVQLTAGLEASRQERGQSIMGVDTLDAATGAFRAPTVVAVVANVQPTPAFSADSLAVYAETSAPLISRRQAVPLVAKLELFASGRVDQIRSEGFRSVADTRPVAYKNTSKLSAYGLRYEPLEGVAFRVSRSTGFKPPTIAQIAPSDPPSPGTPAVQVLDPRRNGESRLITYDMMVTGGNLDLLPESTDSTNLGLILTPRWLQGTRLSLDYLESVRNDAINLPSLQEMVSLEADFPGRVQRGAPDASGVGLITFVDYRFLNLREISSRSLDIALEQALRKVGEGRVVLSLLATRNLSFKVQNTNTGPAVEYVRTASTTAAFNSRQIAWTGNVQLRWEGVSSGFGWSAQYADYMLLPRLAGVDLLTLQGSDRVPRAFTHDVNFNYRPSFAQGQGGARGFLAGSAFTFGIRNVFDRKPRFWAANTNQGIAPYDSDALRGRTVWMRMSRDFQ